MNPGYFPTEDLIDEIIRRIPVDQNPAHSALVVNLGNFQDELWREWVR